MLTFYDWLFGFAIIAMTIINLIINNHYKTMGKIHKVIIENKILLILFIVSSNILILYTIHNALDMIHIVIYITLLIHISIVVIRYHNNVRTKGLVINFKKIFWEDIEYFKKTGYSITVTYNKKGNKKTLDIMQLNFESPYLHEKLKEYEINYE